MQIKVKRGHYIYFSIGILIIVLISFPLSKFKLKKPQQEVVTITFWNIFTAGGPGDAIKTLVKEFNETHPRIRVKILDIPQIEQKLLTATAGGVPPDVAIFDRFRVASYAARNFTV